MYRKRFLILCFSQNLLLSVPCQELLELSVGSSLLDFMAVTIKTENDVSVLCIIFAVVDKRLSCFFFFFFFDFPPSASFFKQLFCFQVLPAVRGHDSGE